MNAVYFHSVLNRIVARVFTAAWFRPDFARKRFTAAAAILLLITASFSAGRIQAAPLSQTSIRVTALEDAGSGSLRAAVEEANARPGADTILFDVDGIIQLQSPLPALKGELTIDGSGRSIVVDGAGGQRIFEVRPGASVRLTALGLQNGNDGSYGGAILSAGILEVSGCTFSGNVSDYGGAISSSAKLVVRDSTFDANEGEGGAIHATGDLTIDNSAFTQNHAYEGGGAILSSGVVRIANSRFEGNRAEFDFGGAIYQTGGVLIIGRTTFRGNFVHNGGGAIFNRGELKIKDSIFTGNNSKWGAGIHHSSHLPASILRTRFEENGAGHWGGAILNDGPTLIESCTFISNSGVEFSGAIHNNRDLQVRNSDFFGNSVSYGSGGAIYSAGSLTVKQSTFTQNTATVNGGAISNTGMMTLQNANIELNTAETHGGGIYNSGRFGEASIEKTRIESNYAYNGGAVYNEGALHLTNTTLLKNEAEDYACGVYNTGVFSADKSQFLDHGSYEVLVLQGGAFYNAEGASAVFNETTFERNFAWYYGGAVANFGTLEVRRSRLLENTALDMGGGIYNLGEALLEQTVLDGNTTWNYAAGVYNVGDLRIDRSALVRQITWSGGAIMNGGRAQIVNSTFSGNYTDFEGAVVLNSGQMSLQYVTIADNTAGDLYASSIQNTGALEIGYSIIASTRVGSNCIGALTATGPNISSDNSCPGFLVVDPRLKPLGDYGGETLTHELMGGSPAIDAAADPSCPAVDQRGITRPQGPACDLGAVETWIR